MSTGHVIEVAEVAEAVEPTVEIEVEITRSRRGQKRVERVGIGLIRVAEGCVRLAGI